MTYWYKYGISQLFGRQNGWVALVQGPTHEVIPIHVGSNRKNYLGEMDLEVKVYCNYCIITVNCPLNQSWMMP